MTTEPDLLAPETETPEAPEAAETPELSNTDSEVPETDLDAAVLADLVPETPDAYAITLADGMEDIDADLNQRLHEAGFSNAQAQLIYDLAGRFFHRFSAILIRPLSARPTVRRWLLSLAGLKAGKSWPRKSKAGARPTYPRPPLKPSVKLPMACAQCIA